jgi:hypothetical protein
MKKNIWFAGCLGALGVIGLGQGCGSPAVDLDSLTNAVPGGDSGAAQCKNGNDCAAPNGCVNGVCGPCSKTIQCATGLVCKNSQCGPDTPGPTDGGTTITDSGNDAGGCKSDAECTGGKVCVAGVCRPCVSSAECANGQVCIAGECHCTTDIQCPSPLKCIDNVCKLATGPDGGTITDAGNDAGCAGKPIYKSLAAVSPVNALWNYLAMNGTAAGTANCVAAGASHYCDYEEVKAAAARGELAGLPNMTFWVHRTTTEGAKTAGPGARCNNWTYNTNDINQGEFGTITGGVVSFDLAPSGAPGGSGGTNRLCGGVNRNILCCHPKCI